MSRGFSITRRLGLQEAAKASKMPPTLFDALFHTRGMQGHVRESKLEQPSGKPGGVVGGLNIDLAAPRTVKGILRAVHAKRMNADAGRRLSAIGEPLSTAPASIASPTPAPAAAVTATSTDPSPEIPETDEGGKKRNSGMKPRDQVMRRVTDKSAVHARAGSRSGFIDPSKFKGGTNVEAAAELLGRVREQLHRSEQRSEQRPESTTPPGSVNAVSPR